MEVTGIIRRRILLISLLLLIAPMVAFPAQFGTQLARTSLINVFFEMAFYAVVVFLFNRRASLIQLLQASGACLVYRFGIGAIFGILISAGYGIEVRVAVTFGMASYVPAILLHILSTPFVIRPVLLQLLPDDRKERLVPRRTPDTVSSESERVAASVSLGKKTVAQTDRIKGIGSPIENRELGLPNSTAEDTLPGSQTGDINGFDRAVRYIGEHGSVSLACVVDHEGLLVSSFKRGEVEPEDWAPMALLFIEGNAMVLKRSDLECPDRIEIIFMERRITVAREQGFALMVIAEQQSDNLLNIRINQAIDIVGRFVTERYGQQSRANVEKTYVSST